VQRQFCRVTLLVGVVELDGAALDQDTPGGGIGGVDAVDLVADGGAASRPRSLLPGSVRNTIV
jgi:hypothetical protein